MGWILRQHNFTYHHVRLVTITHWRALSERGVTVDVKIFIEAHCHEWNNPQNWIKIINFSLIFILVFYKEHYVQIILFTWFYLKIGFHFRFSRRCGIGQLDQHSLVVHSPKKTSKAMSGNSKDFLYLAWLLLVHSV